MKDRQGTGLMQFGIHDAANRSVLIDGLGFNRCHSTLFDGTALLAPLVEVRNDEQDRSEHDK
jgi:hypothetical protein